MALKDYIIYTKYTHTKCMSIVMLDEDGSPQMGNHRKNHQMKQVVSDRFGQMWVQCGLKSTEGQTLNLNLKQILLQ